MPKKLPRRRAKKHKPTRVWIIVRTDNGDELRSEMGTRVQRHVAVKRLRKMAEDLARGVIR